jgi:hypothetical protein
MPLDSGGVGFGRGRLQGGQQGAVLGFLAGDEDHRDAERCGCTGEREDVGLDLLA